MLTVGRSWWCILTLVDSFVKGAIGLTASLQYADTELWNHTLLCYAHVWTMTLADNCAESERLLVRRSRRIARGGPAGLPAAVHPCLCAQGVDQHRFQPLAAHRAGTKR